MKTQQGFTLYELLVVVWFLVALFVFGSVIWAAVHFITKFW